MRRQPERDHVGGDELAQPDAGVKAFNREINQILACGDLHIAAPTRASSVRTAWLIADGFTPEYRRRFAKGAALRNAEERLHAIERTLPDCEVLLHSPSTL